MDKINNKAAEYFVKSMIAWYRNNGRDLPWRHHPTPYQVWVSELMLQQTQVSTVLGYYQRWMERFPNIESLAAASIDEVLGLWAGLGYYRRARYLHEGAQYIVQQLNGRFPDTVEELKKITGIGEYTAGAISSFAFGNNVPAIDGNAERVLSRYFGIEGDLTRGNARKVLIQNACEIAAQGQSALVNQAIMDVGSSICGRNPQCQCCPLAKKCLACLNGWTERIPQKKARIEKTIEFRASLRISDDKGRYLLVKRSPNVLLGNLWEFPMMTIFREREDNPDAANNGMLAARRHRQKQWRSQMGAINPAFQTLLCRPTDIEITHIFTHIRMHVLADCAKVPQSADQLQCAGGDYADYAWCRPDEFTSYPMSTMMHKIITALLASQSSHNHDRSTKPYL